MTHITWEAVVESLLDAVLVGEVGNMLQIIEAQTAAARVLKP